MANISPTLEKDRIPTGDGRGVKGEEERTITPLHSRFVPQREHEEVVEMAWDWFIS